MDQFTATAIHEAGHAIVWALQGEHLGPVGLVSVLPDADSSGRVRGAKRDSGPLTPPQLQAVGYMNAAGVRAEILAGFDPPPEAAAKDAQNIALAQHYSGRGPVSSWKAWWVPSSSCACIGRASRRWRDGCGGPAR